MKHHDFSGELYPGPVLLASHVFICVFYSALLVGKAGAAQTNLVWFWSLLFYSE
jgi:hypothetical protein